MWEEKTPYIHRVLRLFKNYSIDWLCVITNEMYFTFDQLSSAVSHESRQSSWKRQVNKIIEYKKKKNALTSSLSDKNVF